ncbi:hypothetical protein STEG23_002790 [Scotinomys teguina]
MRPQKTFPAHHSVSIFSCKQPQSLPRSQDQPVTLGVRGDFMADGLDQLKLCSQSLGFGTPEVPVQGHPKSVLSCRHRWPGRLFSRPNNLALSLRCRRRFQEAPLSRDFMADGLDHLTLCSQSLGFSTPTAPVQDLDVLDYISPDAFLYSISTVGLHFP